MKRFVLSILATITFFGLLFIASCASKDDKEVEVLEQTVPVGSIVVLPAEVVRRDDNDEDGTAAANPADAVVLTAVIGEVLTDRPDMHLLSVQQKETLLGDFNGTPMAAARLIGTKMESDAILVTTLHRYVERDGKNYSVNRPASVSFDFRLIHAASGRVLCSGSFDETQETLFSNLFSWGKASSRGFKWITARELCLEGVKEKFGNCPYLAR